MGGRRCTPPPARKSNPSAPSTRRLLDGVCPHRSPRARAPPTSSDCSWRAARRRDARTGTGRTALVVATAFGELQTVRALLRAGARPDLNLLAMDPAEAEAVAVPSVLQTVNGR